MVVVLLIVVVLVVWLFVSAYNFNRSEEQRQATLVTEKWRKKKEEEELAAAEQQKQRLVDYQWGMLQTNLAQSDIDAGLAALDQIRQLDGKPSLIRSGITDDGESWLDCSDQYVWWKQSKWLFAINRLADSLEETGDARKINTMNVLSKACNFLEELMWHNYKLRNYGPGVSPTFTFYERFARCLVTLATERSNNIAVRIAAMRAVINSSCLNATTALTENFSDTNLILRVASLNEAAELLEKIRGTYREVEVVSMIMKYGLDGIMAALEEDNEDLCSNAIHVLGLLGSQQAISFLQPLADTATASPAVRRAARAALVRIGEAHS